MPNLNYTGAVLNISFGKTEVQEIKLQKTKRIKIIN